MSSVKIKSARAISIGQGAVEALRKSGRGEVHSVFDRTFNIIIDGNLVGVGRSGISMSPIDLVTDIPTTETMQSLGVKKGMVVIIDDDNLRVDELLDISLSGAKHWQPPTYVKKPLNPDSIARNLERAKRSAVRKAGTEGLGQLLAHVDKISLGESSMANNLNEVARTALPHIVDLLRAAKSGGVGGVSNAAQKLIGLGPGLTPSADDMLTGFAAALWWVSRSLDFGIERVDKTIGAIISHSGKTNLLSRQLLQHAARGEVNERLFELLNSLLGDSDPDIDTLVARLMRIGETSGIDMTLGLLLGLHLGLKIDKKMLNFVGHLPFTSTSQPSPSRPW